MWLQKENPKGAPSKDRLEGKINKVCIKNIWHCSAKGQGNPCYPRLWRFPVQILRKITYRWIMQLPEEQTKALLQSLSEPLPRQNAESWNSGVRPLKGSLQSRINLWGTQVGWCPAHLQFVFLTPALRVLLAFPTRHSHTGWVQKLHQQLYTLGLPVSHLQRFLQSKEMKIYR